MSKEKKEGVAVKKSAVFSRNKGESHDCIDGLSIYSFASLDTLNKYAHANNLAQHTERHFAKPQPKQQPHETNYKYNTRSKLAKTKREEAKFALDNDYLTKLDDNFNDDEVDDDDEEVDDDDEDDESEDEESNGNLSVIWQPTIKTNHSTLYQSNSPSNSTTLSSGSQTLPDCGQKHCQLGCVCESILNTGDEDKKSHCGRIECMFECNCSRKLRSSTRLLKKVNTSKEVLKKTTLFKSSEEFVDKVKTLATTRKSQRVKELCRKNQQSEDFVYYGKKSRKNNEKSSRQLKKHRNRQNNNNNNDNKRQNKEEEEEKEERLVIDEDVKETFTIEAETESKSPKHFEPYTQKIVLQVQYKNGGKSISRSIPLAVEVFTSRWEKNGENAKKVLRLVAKLLQQLETLNRLEERKKNNWKELEFDFENELTVKLFSRTKSDAFEGDEVGVRITRSSRLEAKKDVGDSLTNESQVDHKLDKVKERFFASVSKLMDANKAVTVLAEERQSVESIKETNQIKTETKNSCEKKLVEYSIRNEDDLKREPSRVTRCLPRLLCRNRVRPSLTKSSITSVCSSHPKTINKTGLFLKEVDTLFEKIKLNSAVDKFDTISLGLLEYRPERVQFDAKRDYLTYLFTDEIEFFSNRLSLRIPCSKTAPQSAERFFSSNLCVSVTYPFYDPFKDSNLILDVYRSSGSRDLVDAVSTTLNDMIKVVCQCKEKKPSDNEVALAKPSSVILPPPSTTQPTTLTTTTNYVDAAKKFYQQNHLKLVNNESVKLSESSNLAKSNLTTKSTKSNIVILNKKEDVTNNSTGKTIIIPPTIGGGGGGLKTLVKVVSNSRENFAESSPRIKISSSLMSASSISAIQSLTKNQTETQKPLQPPTLTPNNNNNNNNLTILSNLLNKDKTSIQNKQQTNRMLNLPTKIITTSNSGLTTTKIISFRPNGNNNNNTKIITVPIRSQPQQLQQQQQQASFVSIKPKETPALEKAGNSIVFQIDNDYNGYLENRKRKRKQDLSCLAVGGGLSRTTIEQQQPWRLNNNNEKPDLAKFIKIVESPDNSPVKKYQSAPIKIPRPSLVKDKKNESEDNVILVDLTSAANSPDSKESFGENPFLPKTIRSSFKEISPSESNESSLCSSLSSSHSQPRPQQQQQQQQQPRLPQRAPKTNIASKFLIINDDNEDTNESNESNDEFDDYDEEDDEYAEHAYSTKSRFKKLCVKDLREANGGYSRARSSSSFCSIEELEFASSPCKSSASSKMHELDSSDEPFLNQKSGGKPVANNIHSIRERQRRLRLKKLLIRLKIVLYEEPGSLDKYDVDESQIMIDEFFERKNGKMKSKQNILQEAVQSIQNLERQEKLLQNALNIEHKKNIELKKYLKEFNGYK